MTFLLALLLAEPFPTSFTARQGRSLDGGLAAWAVECTNCGVGGASGGLTNTDLRASPVPMYVMDAGVLNVGPVAISTAPALFIADAGVLNVNFPATQAVSAASLPLPSGAATDATLSQLLDGGVGLLSTIAANQTNGNQQVQIMLSRYPLNPFFPRCNPVRRTGCQP